MQLGMSQSLVQRCHLSLPLGETYGDLPLISLHRVKSRIHTLKTSPCLRNTLVKYLVEQNKAYREDTQRKWNCITANGLDAAVDSLEEELKKTVGLALLPLQDTVSKDDYSKLETSLYQGVDQNYTIVKQWFGDRVDELAYNTDGNIPWPIVQRLRKQLGVWVAERVNPFGTPISDVIDSVAIEEGLNPNNYDDALDIWNALKKVKRPY